MVTRPSWSSRATTGRDVAMQRCARVAKRESSAHGRKGVPSPKVHVRTSEWVID